MVKVIETDARGRAALGQPNQRYIVHEEPNGVRVLEPAEVLSRTEAALLTHPEILKRIDAARQAGLVGVGRRPTRGE